MMTTPSCTLGSRELYRMLIVLSWAYNLVVLPKERGSLTTHPRWLSLSVTPARFQLVHSGAELFLDKASLGLVRPRTGA